MREILFRGKRTDNGEWVEGFPIVYKNGTVVICREGKRNENVSSATLCQYTGLIDSNGKKVFEWDVVSWDGAGEKFVGVIEYADEAFGIRTKDRGIFLCFARKVAVIGNRWDNPELLEVKE